MLLPGQGIIGDDVGAGAGAIHQVLRSCSPIFRTHVCIPPFAQGSRVGIPLRDHAGGDVHTDQFPDICRPAIHRAGHDLRISQHD